MSSLEELLVRACEASPYMVRTLARWSGGPAIFHAANLPPDTERGWGPVQYPRIGYWIDRSGDPERDTAGTVALEVYASQQTDVPAEEVAAAAQELFHTAFFHADEGLIALRWLSNEELPSAPPVTGYRLHFELLAFPMQDTFEPDPAHALVLWTRRLFPLLQVDPEQWTATAATPAVYWRLTGEEMLGQTFWVREWQCELAAHVLSPHAATRLTIARQIAHRLADDMEIELPDSNLAVTGVRYTMGGDMLRTGQVQLTAIYRHPPASLADDARLMTPIFTARPQP